MTNDSEQVQRLLELNTFTINGEVRLNNQELNVICFDKRVVVVLGQENHELLSEIAKKQKITESKLAEKIIEDFLTKHRK